MSDESLRDIPLATHLKVFWPERSAKLEVVTTREMRQIRTPRS